MAARRALAHRTEHAGTRLGCWHDAVARRRGITDAASALSALTHQGTRALPLLSPPAVGVAAFRSSMIDTPAPPTRKLPSPCQRGDKIGGALRRGVSRHWLRSIRVPGCAVRHGTTATRERFSYCGGWFWGGNNPTEAQMNGLIYLIGLIVVILAILSLFGLR
jgi:hypothetical protein